jgi:hypothetical protein
MDESNRQQWVNCFSVPASVLPSVSEFVGGGAQSRAGHQFADLPDMIGCIFGQASETGARTGHLGSSTDLERELLFPLSSTKFLVDLRGAWLLCLG